jgi:hypothetical protein
MPFSAAWSCLAIGLAQSIGIDAADIGVEAISAGRDWAAAVKAIEETINAAERMRNVVMAMNSFGSGWLQIRRIAKILPACSGIRG